jgi:hypothetical protein
LNNGPHLRLHRQPAFSETRSAFALFRLTVPAATEQPVSEKPNSATRAEKKLAERRATDAQVLEDAERLIAA